MIVVRIISLRLRQTFRFIRETGLILLIALLVSIGFIFQVVEQIRSLDLGYLFGFGILVIISLHFNRKDLRFLSKVMPRISQMRWVLLAEYFLLLSPVILLFLIAGPWQNSLALCLCPLTALVLPTRSFYFSERKQKISLSWIPLDLFELKLHIEKNKPGYGIVYAFTLLAPFHIGFFIVGIFFLSTLLLTAFSFYEPKEMVRWEKHFLRKKLQKNLFFIVKVMAPTFALAFIVQFKQWPLLLYLSLIPLLTTFLGLLYKYARLSPIFHQPVNSTILSFFLILLLLPGGILIHLGYCFILLRKAQKNLTYYYA